MDWFEDILKSGAEAYSARELRKMEEAKTEQAALLNAAPKNEQPNAIPSDAKNTTTHAAILGGASGSESVLFGLDTKQALMLAAGLAGALFVIRKVR